MLAIIENNTRRQISLRGRTVRVSVSEPWDWEQNLFGTIEDDRGGKRLKIRLTNIIKGNKFTSDLIELKPWYENETFKALLLNYSVTGGIALIEDNSENFDYMLRGTVTID